MVVVYSILQHFTNWQHWWLGAVGKPELPEVFHTWFTAQDKWTREQVASNKSDMWVHTGLLLQQLDGLVEGYNAVAPAGANLSAYNFQVLQAVGDLLDLLSALDGDAHPDYEHMQPADIMRSFHERTHCSALVRVNGDNSDFFAGHSSWFTFESMVRVFKHYNFQLSVPHLGSGATSFSSYPGLLSSLDDFYTNYDSGLIMLQTTNNIFNKELYNLVVPQSLLAWQRVRMANQYARTGPEWAQALAFHNSGTYNNAYLVPNTKLFTPGKALPANFFTYCEQIPGEVHCADNTEYLVFGHFPSYNVPFFRDIYDKSGYAQVAARFAGNSTAEEELSGINYQMAPRAKIFRRQAGNVHDLQSFKAILRFHEFKTDPYAGGNPYAAICSRGDLASSNAAPNGCMDSKATSYELFQKRVTHAVNGPTWGKWSGADSLPAFSWDEQNGAFSSKYSHVGMPTAYATDFEEQVPGYMQWNGM